MPEQQMHLFEPARPLLTRFGADFFRAVPPKPGVYIMGGEAGSVLYVGQSRNLRSRLGSYKNARPDRAPRKVIRLVHAVRSIVWEECETAQAAQLKENQLLRTHRPRFNVVNTWPRRHRFIALQADDSRLALALRAEAGSGGKVYGAFKGCAPVYSALLRLLWAAWRRPASLGEFPHLLLGLDTPREFVFRFGEGPADAAHRPWPGLVDDFLAGASDQLLQHLNEALPAAEILSNFQRNLQMNDLSVLTLFFERGPKLNRQVRNQHGLPRAIIPPEELDDWLVMAGRQSKFQSPDNSTIATPSTSTPPSFLPMPAA